MTLTRLTTRVAAETLVIAGLLALPAAWLGGASAGLGVLAGGALAALNFWWLTARAAAATSAPPASAPPGTRPPATGWLAAAGLRLAVVAVICGVLFANGWAHPVALIVGITVLPCDLIAQGLRATSEAS
jgi:dipeptide/tripeptide permease